jgi:hypothetical protein
MHAKLAHVAERHRRACALLGFDGIGGLPIAVSQLVNLFREFQFLGEHVPGLSHR